jgi:hypothetical protein
VAAGDGLVFNVGERHFGATEPGHALLLGGLHRLTGIPIPWLGTLTTAAGLLLIVVVMMRDDERNRWAVTAVLGGTLVMGSTAIWVCHGAAAPVALALLLTAAVLASRHPETAGLLAGAAVWLRPDAALGVLVLSLLLWRERRRLPLRFATAAGLVIAAGAVWAWWYFGSPVPSTLAAKRAMARWRPEVWSGGLEFVTVFLRYWSTHYGTAALVLLAAGVAGSRWVWRSGGLAGRLLVLNAAGLAIAYPLLGVPFSPWYVVPIVAAVLYGLAGLWCAAARTAASWWASRTSRRIPAIRIQAAFAAVLVLAVAGRAVPMVIDYRESPHLDAYREAALWIRDRTPGDAVVAFHEVGVIGWYSERPICDLLGLVSPVSVSAVLQPGGLAETVDRCAAESVLEHTRRRALGLTRRPWFGRRYRPVVRFSDAGGGEVVIYRRREPTAAHSTSNTMPAVRSRSSKVEPMADAGVRTPPGLSSSRPSSARHSADSPSILAVSP